MDFIADIIHHLENKIS